MVSRGVVHSLICEIFASFHNNISPISCFSLLLCYSSTQKSFSFKNSPQEESKWSRFKGKVLPKVMKAAKYFTAPPPIDMNASDADQSILRNIPEVAQFDPCATSNQLCHNGGECTNDRGKFYCNCKDKYYGKRCELVANKAACASHSCKNGGVCYTTPTSQKIVDREKLTNLNADIVRYKECRESKSGDECERAKLNENEPTKDEFDAISQTVFYRCQCQLGFQGPLCDHTREERLCEEDFCMGHGYALLKDGQCICACEPEYTGEHCETLLPCSVFPCHNEGICNDEYDATAGTYTAKCVCPEPKELTKGLLKIEGEHCEKITLSGALADIDPCAKMKEFFDKATLFGTNSREYPTLFPLADPDGETAEEVERRLGMIVSNTLCGSDSHCDSEDVNFCNDEQDMCGVVAGPVELVKGRIILFPLPRCACPDLRSGKWCQTERDNACYPTLAEKERGVTFEDRCTSFSQGKCSVNANNERFCECQPDYVGERCEIRAPCARKPCGNNDENCIPIPVELSSPGEQSYRCICDVGDEQRGNDCVYQGVGKCAGTSNPCNHGKCVACPDTSGAETSICNEDEQKRGFRCICAPGYAPPQCKGPLGPCEAHLCLNDGICKVNKEHTYDCSCPPGTSGDYCENIDDYCEFVGNRKCGNTGTCSNSNETIRGFLCSCQWEYRGVDCEVQVGKLAGFYQMFDENYMYSYPITALILCVIFLILADVLCGERGKKRREKTNASSTNQLSKNSKTSKSSKRSKGATDSAAPATDIPNAAAASTPMAAAAAAAQLTPAEVQPVVVPIPSPPVTTLPV